MYSYNIKKLNILVFEINVVVTHKFLPFILLYILIVYLWKFIYINIAINLIF